MENARRSLLFSMTRTVAIILSLTWLCVAGVASVLACSLAAYEGACSYGSWFTLMSTTAVAVLVVGVTLLAVGKRLFGDDGDDDDNGDGDTAYDWPA